MYTAAGLFRWVENGMMLDIEYVQTAEGARERREWRASLPLKNIHTFSSWNELVEQQTAKLTGSHRLRRT